MVYRKQIYRLLTACFVIVLLQPAFGIINEKQNTNLIAIMENRTISPEPHSAFATKEYFNEFQNWFEDRLLGRNNLIRLWASLNGKFFHVLISKEVCMGRDGFLYSPFNLKDEMTDREQKLEQLAHIKQICDKYHAHFVFNLVPHAEWMLGELITGKNQPADIKKIETQLQYDLQKRGIDSCMYGQKMLQLPLEERRSMYFKGDIHWNSKGAFFGAKELLRHLKLNKTIESANIYEVEKKGKAGFYTFKIGWEPLESVYKMPWSEDFERDFTIETHIGNRIIQGEVENGFHKGEVIIINKQAPHNIAVLVLGDSFFGSIQNYLMQDIREIVISHNMDINEPKQCIDLERMLQEYNPEIVIYEKAGVGFFGDSYQTVFGRWKMDVK